MELSKDVLQFIQLLNHKKVRYLIVGGWAVAFHGKPRYTKDIDIFIAVSNENAKNLISVLHEFGFDSLELTEADFKKENVIIQLGMEPNRVDILTGLSAISFIDVENKAQKIVHQTVEMPFIDLESLIVNKTASGRPQDLADIAFLGRKLKKPS